MLKRFVIVGLLALLVSLGLYTLGEALENPVWPGVSAQKAILIDGKSGQMLYGKNEEEKAYPASITKIITALVAIEDREQVGGKGLDALVAISPAAIGVEGSSIYLKPGEKMPMRDLLYGLMLRSGNDAAVAIAEEVGPGTEAFVRKMNLRAEEAGATNSHFMNPNGLQDENHYTTAKDMALIAKAAMENKEFRTIASAKNWTAKRGIGEFNYFITKNKVVYEYEGSTGTKIGFTKAAGRTLVASAKRDGMEVICVVLNAPDWFQDTYKLMDYAFEKYDGKIIARGQTPTKSIKVLEGEKSHVKIGTKNTATVSVQKGEKSHISIAYNIPKVVEAPIERWDKAGELKIFSEGKFLYAEPLYYLEDVERKQ